MEYYAAFRRKEILAHAAMRVNLEEITLSEINQSQEDGSNVVALL